MFHPCPGLFFLFIVAPHATEHFSARLPNFVEPMKAKLVGSMPSGDWIYEIKFDGYRALALRGGSETRILSRNQKDLGTKFPEVKDSIAALDVQDAIIDGEIVALDEKGRSSFQLLQGIDIGQLITEWTRDDRLRQPVFLGIREDKNANEVVREKAN